MRTQRGLAVGIFAVIFPMLGGLVSAHHSQVGYDRNRKITLKGVVAEWRWRNPHAFLVFDVKDESGKVVRWTGELSSPISLIADGLGRDSFKTGDEVTVTAYPATKAPQSVIQKIVNVDGKVMIDRSNPLAP